jgi:MFS family permease
MECGDPPQSRDRIGERLSFAIAIKAFGLVSLMYVVSYPALLAAAIALGLGAALPLVSALLARAFGRNAFAAMMGLMIPLLIPFQMVGAPYAAWVFDTTGSYDAAFWSFVGALGVAAAGLTLIRLPAAEDAAPLATPEVAPAE